MTTVSTSPVTLNDGSASLVRLGNTGTVTATVTWGDRSSVLGPGFTLDVHPNGSAVTAVTTSGSTTLTVDLTGVPPSTGGGVSPETAAATYALLAPTYVAGRAYVVGELVVDSGTLYRITTAYTSSGGSLDLSKATALGGSGGGTFADRGTWGTSTAYVVGDVVTQAGQRYLVRTAHTSGVFATDLAASRLIVFDAVVAAVDASVVHLTGAETVAGVKTFSSSPVIPTATAGDNSAKASSTAYADAAVAAEAAARISSPSNLLFLAANYR